MRKTTKFAGNGLSRTAMIFRIATMGGKFERTAVKQNQGR